ncbi:MAG: hypothetical protein HZY75_04175 [Nocardioidaceae bacterium]|nr:MAG: hypothetical protein HZY75_04175 [Nocardioidaceae bacterium]
MRRIFVAAFTAALVIATPAVAEARTAHIKDAKGDVYTMTGQGELVKVGSIPNADLRRTTIRHRAHRVVVIGKYFDLRKNKDFITYAVQLRTNTGLTRDILVDANPEARRGEIHFAGPKKELRCKGITHRISYRANTVRISIPRSCLKRPRYIQAQVMAVAVGDLTDPNSSFFLDNGMGKRIPENEDWSRKVRR